MIATPLIRDKTSMKAGPAEMFALGIRGQAGRSGGYGFISFGKNWFGTDVFNLGVYRKAVKGYNQYSGPPTPGNSSYYVLCRTYTPTNPRTTIQQANRQKIADAVSAWQSLTTEQKANYNQKGARHNRRGYNLYIQEYLKSH